MNKMKELRTSKKLMVAVLTIAMLLSFIPFSFFMSESASAINSSFAATDAGIDNDDSLNLPAEIGRGQVWTGKDVTTDSDVLSNGKFNVQLSALGGALPAEQYDVVFVLDTSSSMTKSNRLQQMKDAVNPALDIILKNNNGEGNPYNRIAVVTFNSKVDVLVPWTSPDIKELDLPSITTGTGTNIQLGLHKANELITGARADAKPVIILLSDGEPYSCFTNFDNPKSAPHPANDNTYAAYTILYAAWLKQNNPNLQIYTVGIDIGNSARSQAVLNPDYISSASGLQSSINDANPTSSPAVNKSLLDYPDDSFLVSTSNSADIDDFNNKLRALAESLSGALYTGDLVIRDTIGNYFDFEKKQVDDSEVIEFTLDGIQCEAKYDSATNSFKYPAAPTSNDVKVEFNGKYVEYTIPSSALKTIATPNAVNNPIPVGTAFNTLVFGVVLSDAAQDTDMKYYTNNNCNAEFSPTESNSFYYEYIDEANTQTGEDSTNYTIPVPGSEEKQGAPVITNHNWFAQYDGQKNINPIFDYIIVDGIEYKNGIDSTTITSARNGKNCTVIITRDVTDEGIRTHTEIVIKFKDNNTTGSDLRAYDQFSLDCIRNGNTLTVSKATLGGMDFTNCTASYNNKNFSIDIKDSSNSIKHNFTSHRNNFTNYISYTKVFSNVDNTTATKTVTKYKIIPEVAGDCTINSNPTSSSGNGSNASVTAGGKTYSGNVSSGHFSNSKNWSFKFDETDPSNSNIVRHYTITRSDGTLTVAYTENTFTPAHTVPINGTNASTGIVTQSHSETGWIILADANGSLKVEKQVTGYEGTKKFSFTVELGEEAETALLYNKSESEPISLTKDSDGKYRFELGAGDYAVFTGLEHNSSYTVTETPDDAFKTTIISSNTHKTKNWNGEFRGKIIGGPTDNVVTFTNAYKVAALTVGKKVVGTAPEGDTEYGFSISFTESAYKNIKYSIYDKDTKSWSDATVLSSLDLNFTLRADELVKFFNVPVSTKYIITETTDDGAIISHKTGSNAYVSGNEAEGTLYLNTKVTFKNDYCTPAPLTIAKSVTADNNTVPTNLTFDFDIWFYKVDDKAVKAASDAKAALDDAEDALEEANAELASALTALESALGSNFVSDSADDAAAQAVTLLTAALPGFDSATSAAAQLSAAIITATDAYNAALTAALGDDESDPAVIAALEDALNNLNALTDIANALDNYNAKLSAKEDAETALGIAQSANESAAAAATPVPYKLSDIEMPEGLTPVNEDEGKYSFTLIDGGTMSFVNLPVGLGFTVTESPTAPEAREVSITDLSNSIKKDETTATATGRVLWDGVTPNGSPLTITYTNDYSIIEEELTLIKTYNTETAPFWKIPVEGFEFEVTIGNGEPERITISPNTPVTIGHLLPGTEYRIEELATGEYVIQYSSTNNSDSQEGSILHGFMPSSSMYEAAAVTVTCDNQYELPIEVTKSVDQPNATTGTTVTYTGSVTYENPYDVAYITLADPMFAEIPDSFTIDLGGAAPNNADWDNDPETPDSAYVWNSEHNQLTIYLQQTEETDTNTIAFSYKVKYDDAGTYPNTVNASVAYYYEPNPQYAARGAETEQISVYVYRDNASASVKVTAPDDSNNQLPGPPAITSDPEYGTLTVVKNVTGDNAPANERFNITVQFIGTLGSIRYNGTNNPDGVYTLSLAAGESATFTNIPLNTSYTVTEALTAAQSDAGWTAPTDDIEDRITDTTPVTVSVNNVYDADLLGDADIIEEDQEPETGVAGDADKESTLPQTGGIAFSTLLGIFGLVLIALGGTAFIVLRRKSDGKSRS